MAPSKVRPNEIKSNEKWSFGRPFWFLLLLLSTLSCRLLSAPGEPTPSPVSQHQDAAAPTATASAVFVATQTAPPSPTASFTATPLPTELPTTVPTATATPQPTPTLPGGPLSCSEPPQDYTRVSVGDHTLNARTLAMLEVAQQIYEGPGDIMRITQGSYRGDVAQSFGTHSGGGAVDISIRNPQQESVLLWDEAPRMVMALRYAGFAAWFRQPGDLGEGSAAHIHAIAVGDGELSDVAQDQVAGPGGYLQGMDGLIPPYGPNPDPHGGPVICPWMRDLYPDLLR